MAISPTTSGLAIIRCLRDLHLLYLTPLEHYLIRPVACYSTQSINLFARVSVPPLLDFVSIASIYLLKLLNKLHYPYGELEETNFRRCGQSPRIGPVPFSTVPSEYGLDDALINVGRLTIGIGAIFPTSLPILRFTALDRSGRRWMYEFEMAQFNK